MDILRLMMYSQQMEYEKLQDNNGEVKRAKTSYENFSNAKYDGQGRQKSKQRFPNKGSSSAIRGRKDRFSIPKPKVGVVVNLILQGLIVQNMVKKHEGKCIVGSDG